MHVGFVSALCPLLYASPVVRSPVQLKAQIEELQKKIEHKSETPAQ
jgi:hypothetical protein